VRFHNGEPFDADDVVHTLNFVADPANKVTSQQNVNWIARAERVAADKVRLHLKTPFPAALEYLSGPLVIYPNEYYAVAGPRGMSARPIGSGPYRVVDAEPGRRIRLEINRDYFRDSPRPQPKISRIELRLIPDQDTQIAELLAGNLDWMQNVPTDLVPRLASRPDLSVVAGDTMRVAFLLLNRRDDSPTAALRDIRVRQAIAHSIDRETMLRQLVGAGGKLVNAICYTSQFGCAENVKSYGYDPARARELLAAAGFAGGFDVDLYAYRDRTLAEALMGYLRAVGIRSELRYMQAPAMRDAMRQNKTSMVNVTWGSFAINDVSAIVSAFFKYTVEDITRDPELRDLIEAADTIVDPARRRELYGRAFAKIADQAYAVPLYTLPANYAHTRDLEFKPYPDQYPRFWLSRWK
jgi:peptide/nickel transport system substrate-binding protein